MILTPNLIAREINGEHRKPSVIFIILGIIAFGLVLLTPFILSKRGCHGPEPYQLDVPVPQRQRLKLMLRSKSQTVQDKRARQAVLSVLMSLNKVPRLALYHAVIASIPDVLTHGFWSDL
ncbi:hypothetical protein V3481_010907 [Fusarium oxysporum f. sp. vasinfectum]